MRETEERHILSPRRGASVASICVRSRASKLVRPLETACFSDAPADDAKNNTRPQSAGLAERGRSSVRWRLTVRFCSARGPAWMAVRHSLYPYKTPSRGCPRSRPPESDRQNEFVQSLTNCTAGRQGNALGWRHGRAASPLWPDALPLQGPATKALSLRSIHSSWGRGARNVRLSRGDHGAQGFDSVISRFSLTKGRQAETPPFDSVKKASTSTPKFKDRARLTGGANIAVSTCS